MQQLSYDNNRFAKVNFFTDNYKVGLTQDLTLIFQIKGKTQIHLKDSFTEQLEVGEFFVLWGETSKAQLKVSHDSIICNITINRNFLSYLEFDNLTIQTTSKDRSRKEYRKVVQYIYEILNLLNYSDELHKEFDAIILKLIGVLGQSFSSNILLNSHEKLQSRIKRYIDHNYFQPMNQSDIADYFHITPQYLSKLFKLSTGQSVLDYLNTKRVVESTNKLKYSNSSISEVAYEYGFNNINSYNRIFKSEFGITPSQYRQENKVDRVEDALEKETLVQEIDLIQNREPNRDIYHIHTDEIIGTFNGLQNAVSITNLTSEEK